MLSPPKIAIIGAGPAGLTLASLLHNSKPPISFTIYELDSSATSRPDQGGTLDLHTSTGLAAIRACGLWDAFLEYARYEGQEFIFCDKNATELVHVSKGPGERPEIDRQRLKEVLLGGVPEEWDVAVQGREMMEGPFDLVVGADGAWSKVRARLTDMRPLYSGVSGFEMDIAWPAEKCPHVDKKVGKGSHFGSSDRKMLNGQRLGNGSIKVRSWFTCPEHEAKQTLENLGKKATLERALDRYDGWAPEMTELLKQGDLDSLRHWTLYEIPVGCKWEHRPGFTLIGDAASLATPFSGEGANKAMKDALELAELTEMSRDSDNGLTLDEAVFRYEQSMFPRAEKLQSTTHRNKDTMFGPDAPIGLMTGMLKTMGRESPSILGRLAASIPVLATVYSYFWIRQQIGLAVRRLWRRT